MKKAKLVEILIKGGNNPDDAKKMVNEHFEYVERVYPEATMEYKAFVIRTIY